ncbi:UNVERIFIED_CONTAM: hypothetical protein FKN15_008782 [Acipenser sinensis]
MSKPASSFTPRNPRAAGLWRIEASSAGVRLSSLGAWLSGSAVARRFWLPNPRECQSQCDTPFRIPSKDQRLRTARTQTCAPLTVTHLAHHTAVLLPASEGIPSRQQRSDQAAHQCCQLSCYQAVLTPDGNVLRSLFHKPINYQERVGGGGGREGEREGEREGGKEGRREGGRGSIKATYLARNGVFLQ